MRKSLVAFAILSVGLFGFGPAFAGEWLAGASVGEARHHDYSVGGPIANSDDSDSGYRAFGGYMFSPIMGVVGSYVDLGEMNYDGPAFGGFTDVLSADGFDFSFLAGWAPGSQERVSLYGTVGFFVWKQDVNYTDLSGNYRYEDDGTSLSWGVGSEFSVGDTGKWGIHISVQRFMDVGDPNNSGHENDRDLISAGANYRFGR